MDAGEPINETAQPDWRVIGAAVQGISHRRLGLPSQDAQDHRVLPAGVLLVAVADGAGSADRSDQGARCAVTGALAALADALETGLPEESAGWESLMCMAFEQARQAVERLADEAGEPVRAFATTLTCALVAGDRLVVGQLGDGAVILMDPTGTLTAATRLQRGEYANETYFLTQEQALEQMEIQCLEQPVRALAMMSDGLTRLALSLPSQEPYLPFFNPLFAFASAATDEEMAADQLAAFLDSERVCARTDDDKALVLAVRPSKGVPGIEPAPE